MADLRTWWSEVPDKEKPGLKTLFAILLLALCLGAAATAYNLLAG
jgi:hypothetical protein